jgi:hypothetical protein
MLYVFKWIFDNNIFLGYGLCFRLQAPINGLDDIFPVVGNSVAMAELYSTDILGTDWFSTFVSFGYML